MITENKIEFSTTRDALMPLYLLLGELFVIIVGGLYYRVLEISPPFINFEVIQNLTQGDRIVGTLFITAVVITIPIFVLASIRIFLTDEFYELNSQNSSLIVNNIRWDHKSIKIDEIEKIYLTKGAGTTPGGYEEPEEPWMLCIELSSGKELVIYSAPLEEIVLKRKEAIESLMEKAVK